MRARGLKPAFFKNELLATSDPLYGWIFQGLWCLADRAGRLEDRPRRIHLEVNPGRAFEGTDEALTWLAEQGFIVRYGASGKALIQVVNFERHQHPHVNEKPSELPAPPESMVPEPDSETDISGQDSGASTVQAPETTPGRRGENPSDFLTPDCGLLTAEKGSARGTNGKHPPASRGTVIPDDFELTESRRAYAEREGVPPEREFDKFCDYWRSVSGAKARKRDWDATWRNWCRKAAEHGGQASGSRSGTGSDQFQGAI